MWLPDAARPLCPSSLAVTDRPDRPLAVVLVPAPDPVRVRTTDVRPAASAVAAASVEAVSVVAVLAAAVAVAAAPAEDKVYICVLPGHTIPAFK